MKTSMHGIAGDKAGIAGHNHVIPDQKNVIPGYKNVIPGLTRDPGTRITAPGRGHGLRVKPAMTSLFTRTTAPGHGYGLRVRPAMTSLFTRMTALGRGHGLRVRPAMTSLLMVFAAGAAFAQMTPVGTWRNIDDKTGEAKAEIRIVDSAGTLSGRIEKRLLKDARPDAVCVECKDERKDQPMNGLEIIRGARKAEGKDVWEGGKILDPENGREYGLRLTPVDGGRKLEVRGSIGPFGRTQTWVRVQ
jgi:uncharacterized protein (DUF2147 family)